MEERERLNKCTIVVSSCDRYEDLWPVFFEILKKQWATVEYPIVLNTESKSFSYDGLDITCLNLYKEIKEKSWTERLRRTLERIETDYIIFLLDDFFLQGKVDDSRIDQCISYMEEDPHIANFCFMETFGENIKDNRYEGFERRPLIADYKLNCQAALWSRRILIDYLKHDENPWEWETMGNWRTYRHPEHKFYSQIPNGNYVFPYIFYANGINWGGLAVYRGRWYLPYVQPLFEKYHICVDYSARGTVCDREFEPSFPKKKEEYIGIKRKLYFMIRIYRGMSKLLYCAKNIKHFL